MSRLLCATCGLLIAAVTSGAAPFQVPVDSDDSRLYFELCIVDKCDTDSSSVAGGVTIDLDSVEDPALIWLHDFDLRLSDDLDLALSWGFAGTFSATGSGLRMRYAQPGTPLGPEAVEGTSFTFLDVPTDGEGSLSYSSWGLPCVGLQAAGYPCDGVFDISEFGTQTADEFSGNVASVDRVVSLTSEIDLVTYLDPTDPGLGSLRVYGTVHGEVYVPLPGDLDEDGDVDLVDFAAFEACLNGPGVTDPPAGCAPAAFTAADLEVDGDVDLADFLLLAIHFTG